MNHENKPCSELHIQAIRREIDPKRCSKKPFRNERLRDIGLFSTRKSTSMFWKVLEPTVTDANVKPESPDERVKSLLKRYADPGQDEDFMERAFQRYKRAQKMLELERSQVVSDIGVDENLTDNKLNVGPVMDVAEKKSMEGSTTMRDAWLSNSDKSSQGRTRITMNLENKPSSELHIQAIRRQIDPKRSSKKPFRNEGLRDIRLFSTRKSTSMFWKELSDIGVDENLTDNKLNVVPVMDVAE